MCVCALHLTAWGYFAKPNKYKVCQTVERKSVKIKIHQPCEQNISECCSVSGNVGTVTMPYSTLSGFW